MSPLNSAVLTAVGADESLPAPKSAAGGDPDGDFGSTLSTVAAQTPAADAEATHHRAAASATDPSSTASATAGAVTAPPPVTTRPAAPVSSATASTRSVDPPAAPSPGDHSVPGPQGAGGDGSGPGAGPGPVTGLVPGRGPQTAPVVEADVGSAPPEDESAVAQPPLSAETTVGASTRSALTPGDPTSVVDDRSYPASGSAAPGDGSSTTDAGSSAPLGTTATVAATGGLPEPGAGDDRSMGASAPTGSSSAAAASAAHSAGPAGSTASSTSGSSAAPGSGGGGPSASPAPISAASAPAAAPAASSSSATVAANSSASPPPSPAQQVVIVLASLRSSLDGTHEVTIGLEPEGLGSVKATITVNAGQIVVQLGADNEQARDALRQALPLLRHELAGDGSSASVLLAGDGGDGRRARAGDRSTSNGGSDDEIDLDDPTTTNVSTPGSLRGHIDLHL